MCGIVGILLAPQAADPRRLAVVEAMADMLRHRGPDGGGLWADSDAGVALGHRRLAIVDLSEAGRQPMRSHDASLVITYNGEIYNFPELRTELESLGHEFHGHSDTEAMLAAFESFGIEAALGRFAGMFALGLWDRKRRVLHLVRDRMGKKPLYVALVEGALLFASELKAFRADPRFRPSVDPAALAAVLRQGWIPDQHCIWSGVFKLPPGTMLSVSPDDLVNTDSLRLRERVRPWWSLAEVAEAGQRNLLALDIAEIESELDSLLRTAVRERMLADVPLGAFLSGGIDSSTVVALMQAQSSRPVRTFTIGFDEAGYDEADAAARVAQHLGTDHTELRVTPAEARAVIPDLPRIWDEPFADESQIPTLLVSQLARQHVTVALSGDGGDEAFGGYARHFMPARFAPVFGLPMPVRRAAASALHVLSPQAMEGLMRALPLPSHLRRTLSSGNLQKFTRVLDADGEQDLYDRLTTLSADSVSLGSILADDAPVPPLPDAISRMIFRDMTGYLPGDILVKLDRATMAVSLEGRCPLLDHRVIEFAWRLPSNLKVRGGKGKWLLRRILRRYVPDALFERPKQGFNVPVGAWLSGPLRDWAADLLDASRLRREGFMDAARVQDCWQEHLTGRRDRGNELWAILMVQAWLDANHVSGIEPPPPELAEAGMPSSAARAGDWRRYA
ncbi:asparagine synthase (glutamine-hydrolyzing) [Limobrevibacterium gyesilva]|uniref:asparagine synthase (glutamine-hydrolyzing) n=1 Tax=Limobrevibacterium gyesilva TaxID=2991712 RepID=A0AA42CHB2_9PROT|nr:asparagine synthase (glutamine-hydrolyzing) [Limobrevibacterium gyesilva]MCW3474797.1 asparagine synthase (glutamine-hydrolyzing) [Limobrevibacterium gyesilva]